MQNGPGICFPQGGVQKSFFVSDANTSVFRPSNFAQKSCFGVHKYVFSQNHVFWSNSVFRLLHMFCDGVYVACNVSHCVIQEALYSERIYRDPAQLSYLD